MRLKEALRRNYLVMVSGYTGQDAFEGRCFKVSSLEKVEDTKLVKLHNPFGYSGIPGAVQLGQSENELVISYEDYMSKF